jgi:hypothetical protein
MSVFVVSYEIDGVVKSYPSPLAFNYIFLVAFLVAVVQAALILFFRRRASIVLKRAETPGGAAAA